MIAQMPPADARNPILHLVFSFVKYIVTKKSLYFRKLQQILNPVSISFSLSFVLL